MPELSEKINLLIRDLCDKGDACADDGDYESALGKYTAAWEMLPEPRTQWEQATWILGAMGDANFLGESYAAGRESLVKAMECPNGVGDPYLHFRLGQCEFELGNLDRAAEEFGKAYAEAGSQVFDEEGDKYFDFLKTRLKPPEGGW